MKSLRPVSLFETRFDKHGLVNDRRLMIVRPDPRASDHHHRDRGDGESPASHRFLTQRQSPSLATIEATEPVDITTTASSVDDDDDDGGGGRGGVGGARGAASAEANAPGVYSPALALTLMTAYVPLVIASPILWNVLREFKSAAAAAAAVVGVVDGDEDDGRGVSGGGGGG